MNTVTVISVIPDNELTDLQVAARLKAQHRGETAQTLYSRFVKARNLKPGIDAKAFAKLLDGATPDVYCRREVVEFVPTHRSVTSGALVQVTEESNGVRKLVYDDGSSGSFPLDVYQPDGYKFADLYSLLERE